MENKTVAELEAMTKEEVNALTPQQKANRTKVINASKPARPESGALANSAINAAAQQSGNAIKPGDDPQALENARLKQEEAKRLEDAAKLKEQEDALAKEQEAAAAQQSIDDEAAILAKYGPGYIKAKRDNIFTYFSAIAWDLLGKNKEGWVPDVKVPDEVAQFKKGGQ